MWSNLFIRLRNARFQEIKDLIKSIYEDTCSRFTMFETLLDVKLLFEKNGTNQFRRKAFWSGARMLVDLSTSPKTLVLPNEKALSFPKVFISSILGSLFPFGHPSLGRWVSSGSCCWRFLVRSGGVLDGGRGWRRGGDDRWRGPSYYETCKSCLFNGWIKLIFAWHPCRFQWKLRLWVLNCL